jgi:hypothetical protein
MKKLALIGAFSFTALSINAQVQRLSLYEEFTSANCVPCAGASTYLKTLLSKHPSSALLITYHSPGIADVMSYEAYMTLLNRENYYGVVSMPNGRLNGTGLGTGTASPSTPGYPNNLISADIKADSATGSPFSLSVAHSWTTTGDSISVSVNVLALAALAPTGANMRLRVAIVENMFFARPPGINSETEFSNVVREMIPDANGTQLSASWIINQSQSLNFKVPLSKNVNKAEAFVVAWIQNDANKVIYQSAKSTIVPISADAGSFDLHSPAHMVCDNGSTTVSPSVLLKNSGFSTLSSAKIFYKVNNGTYQTYNWTGSIAAGTSKRITLPAIPIKHASPGFTLPNTNVWTYNGQALLTDSVALPNGLKDLNSGNNVSQTLLMVYKDSARPLPVSQNFEASGHPEGWITLDTTFISRRGWTPIQSGSINIGHNSKAALQYENGTGWGCAQNLESYAILPTADLSGSIESLEFYLACSPRDATSQDKLEVVYSSDCGSTWKTLWKGEGSSLATASYGKRWDFFSYYPAANDWARRQVDLRSVPAGSMLAFRGTCRDGDPYLIDDVTISTKPVSVARVNTPQLKLYPNPAVDVLSIDAGMLNTEVSLKVYDAVSRLVLKPLCTAASKRAIELQVAELPSGSYYITFQTGAETWTQRFSVSH